MAEPKLYSMIIGMPQKYMRRYKTARAMTSAGAPINVRIGRAITMPAASRNTPETSATAIMVCTASLIFSRCPLPNRFAVTTLAPTERPVNSDTSSPTTDEFEPTAAMACGLVKRPTTARSAALNNCCSMLLSASGSAKRMIFMANGPWIISISCFPFDICISPAHRHYPFFDL